MKRLPFLACISSLAILASLAAAVPADAKKQKNQQPTSKTVATEHPRDVNKSLDELLTKPVPQMAPDIAPERRQLEKLHGAVEATEGAGGATGGALQGQTDASQTGLRSGVSETGGANKEMQPKVAPNTTTILKGSASATHGKAGLLDDPDSADRELMVEWDRWRNRFLRAVQLQIQASVNHPDGWEEEDARPNVRYDPYTGQAIVQPRFPMGTEAWFTCEVTVDRRVKNLSIVRSSGIQAYDKAVLEGVKALEGTSLLQYPDGSKRVIVGQTAGIRTAETSEYQYHHFGDVERQRQRMTP